MWTECKVFLEDLRAIHTNEQVPWRMLEGKSVFITGATGLIGYTVTCALLYHEMQNPTGLKIVVLVRDLETARKKYASQLKEGCKLQFVVGDVLRLPEKLPSMDYIIHCASPTASRYFLSHPVEVMDVIINGTRNILTLGKEKAASGMVYLSSMEAFGQVSHHRSLRESEMGTISLSEIRSCYPEGKRAAELLCACYAAEYQMPVCSVRLAQTFGPGVSSDDRRVFAYMVRCALKQEPIEIKTNGLSENMYLYTADAVAAILILLTKGQKGECYNVGNPTTYCSIKKLGQIVSRVVGQGRTEVRTNTEQDCRLYPPERYWNMDVCKIEGLGWKATTDLPHMLLRMIDAFEV